MERESLIFESILENMSAGVITVNVDGCIEHYNPMAAEILGLPRDEVLGKNFAETFLPAERLDEFNQNILDAVYEAKVGHQQVVRINSGEDERILSLAISYLQVAQEGETRKAGIIGIFNDVTEIRKLRESEQELAESVRAQNAELQDAYLKIEYRNKALATMVKKGRVAAVSIVGLFLAAGLYATVPAFLPALPEPSDEGMADTVAQPVESEHLLSVTVEPKQVASTVAMSGRLAPHRKINIVSPISGTVAAINFQYGERVEKGHLLIQLDTAEVENELRRAQAARIKALRRFHEIEDWANSVEVARARQSVTRSKLALEDRKNQLEQSAFLLEKGLVSASEHQSAERQYRDQMLNYEANEFDLQNVLAKADSDEKKVARLELDNALEDLRAQEEKLQQAVIRAPISGVVLESQSKGSESVGAATGLLAKGRSVSQGEQLLTIGDLDNLIVTGRVDEVHVTSIRLGQDVRVVGDAFHELELRGTVVHISSQADQTRRGRGPASFEIVVGIERLTEEQRPLLLPGMSADLEVVTYNKQAALVVPIRAVQIREGQAWLRVRDKDDGSIREVKVKTGITTLGEVEILQGIEAGDEVVFPAT